MSKNNRQVTPFKYAGTPEQVSKVAAWLIVRYQLVGIAPIGGEPHTSLFVDPCCDRDGFTYQLCSNEGVYSRDDNLLIPPEYELEIFGTTQGITGKVENPWVENTGDSPALPEDVQIDVRFRDGDTYYGHYVDDWYWKIKEEGEDITHYRIHKPDEEYFVAPETPSTKVADVWHMENGGSIEFKEENNVENKGRIVSMDEAIEIIEASLTPTPLAINAVDILNEASRIIGTRAVERDKGESERSMASCVKAFNALTGHALTEEQGWLFMVVLKMARSQGGCFKLDDYLDGAAYFALAGEAAANG